MLKFYITTPIYYVNSEPHIGHIYTTVTADALARYYKIIKKNKTFFLTGTDEHGIKITQSAERINKQPKEFVDELSEKFKSIWNKFNISYDRFIRTTEKQHIHAVQRALKLMYDKKDIYLGKYYGLYCRECEQFKNKKDLIDNKCPDHQIKPERISEESYIFKMSKYHDKILKKIKTDEFKIRPIERKNEIISFYEQQGLKDVSFSRKNISWGVNLPWDKNHTTYVWADAFLNYLTGLNWDGKNFQCSDLSSLFPPDLQIIGKDILRVHATIWPAMLLSLDLPLPKTLFAHGFFLVNRQKMSKTIGNVISPDDLINRYGIDASRYLLLSATTFGKDADITLKQFDEKYNADLANGLGNLVARVSNLLEKNKIKINLKLNKNKNLIEKFNQKIQNCALDSALKILWNELRKNDEFLTKQEPWKLNDQNKIKQVLKLIAQDILNIAYLLRPFMPETAEKIINQFIQRQIKKGKPLFLKIDKTSEGI